MYKKSAALFGVAIACGSVLDAPAEAKSIHITDSQAFNFDTGQIDPLGQLKIVAMQTTTGLREFAQPVNASPFLKPTPSVQNPKECFANNSGSVAPFNAGDPHWRCITVLQSGNAYAFYMAYVPPPKCTNPPPANPIIPRCPNYRLTYDIEYFFMGNPKP